MLKVDARGDACPLPVVKAKKAISELKGAGEVEVLVDNEIAVQNLTKMAQQKGYQYSAEKLAEQEYRVLFTVGDAAAAPTEEVPVCAPDTLLKAFVFALTQQDRLPKTILFYNGGAALTCEGSPMLEDLKALEAQGVEIMTCGTCLNFYGLTEKLAVGSVTNMYAIVEKLTQPGQRCPRTHPARKPPCLCSTVRNIKAFERTGPILHRVCGECHSGVEYGAGRAVRAGGPHHHDGL